MENKNKLMTIYEKEPLSSFNDNNNKIHELMTDDITHPVGYVKPKRI